MIFFNRRPTQTVADFKFICPVDPPSLKLWRGRPDRTKTVNRCAIQLFKIFCIFIVKYKHHAKKFIPYKRITVCSQGMQFFLGQVGREEDTICVCLRSSAVNLSVVPGKMPTLSIRLYLPSFLHDAHIGLCAALGRLVKLVFGFFD